MRKYETIFILDPRTEEDQINVITDKVKGIIENSGGQIENVDFWGRKKLAYEINKISEGYFTLINFTCDVDLPKELDRNFRIMDSVIRHIIVKQD